MSNALAAKDQMIETRAAATSLFASRRSFWSWLVVTLLFAFVYARFPTGDLTVGLDPSWNGVLAFAHEHNLRFGRDIVFTYGPLGFLSVTAYIPLAIKARFALEILLALFVSAGVCLLSWRVNLIWRIATFTLLVLFTATIHWAGDELSTVLGLFSWGMLALLDNGRRSYFYVGCVTGFAVVGGLMKFTSLVAGTFTLGILAIDLVLRGHPRVAAAFLCAFVVGWLSGWLLLDQQLSNVPVFLLNWIAMSGGYMKAMGMDGINWIACLFIAIAAIANAIIRLRNAPFTNAPFALVRRGLQLVWLCGLVFLLWKYGLVRADDEHISVFLVFMPAFALLLEAVPATSVKLRWWGRGAGIACALMAVCMLQVILPAFLKGECLNRIHTRVINNRYALFSPSVFKNWRLESNRANHDGSQLPKTRAAIGRDSVDVFGFRQNSALFNDLNYQPRPVFQSYAAYSRRFMEMNEHHFLSNDAPRFVLLALQAIDDRFPSLEDSLALRAILQNYDAAFQEEPFLVLQRRTNAAVAPQLTLLQNGETEPGKQIDLARFGETNLWMELDVAPTLAGRALSFLYKPSVVRLQVWRGEGDSHMASFRAPPPMMSAGFLVSPILLETSDVAKLYNGDPVLRPTAVGVDCGNSGLWSRKIPFRIYRIDKIAGR